MQEFITDDDVILSSEYGNEYKSSSTTCTIIFPSTHQTSVAFRSEQMNSIRFAAANLKENGAIFTCDG